MFTIVMKKKKSEQSFFNECKQLLFVSPASVEGEVLLLLAI